MAAFTGCIDPILKEMINSILESIDFALKLYTRNCTLIHRECLSEPVPFSEGCTQYKVSV